MIKLLMTRSVVEVNGTQQWRITLPDHVWPEVEKLLKQGYLSSSSKLDELLSEYYANGEFVDETIEVMDTEWDGGWEIEK